MIREVRLLAGTLVIGFTAAGFLAHPAWLLGNLAVGINLVQYAFTDWCLAERIVQRFKSAKERES